VPSPGAAVTVSASYRRQLQNIMTELNCTELNCVSCRLLRISFSLSLHTVIDDGIYYSFCCAVSPRLMCFSSPSKSSQFCKHWPPNVCLEATSYVGTTERVVKQSGRLIVGCFKSTSACPVYWTILCNKRPETANAFVWAGQKLPLPIGDFGPPSNTWFIAWAHPSPPPPQTPSRSVHPFLHGSRTSPTHCQTDRQTTLLHLQQ